MSPARGFWVCVSALLFFSLLHHSRLSPLACFLVAILVECFCCCFAFARAHREAATAMAASPLPQEHDEVETTKAPVSLLDHGAFTPSHRIALVLTVHLGFSAFTAAMEANNADYLSGLGLGMLAASILVYTQLRYSPAIALPWRDSRPAGACNWHGSEP